MIGIIDYGMGNLRSVLKAIEFLGGEGRVTARAEELDACEKLILPGVGSFGAGMENLRRGGLDEYVRRRAAEGTPLLGICLGMQFLLEESEEEGLFHRSSTGSLPARSFTLYTATLPIRRRSTRWAKRSIIARLPLPSEKTTCSACSSTPKRAGLRGCSFCAII